MIKVIYTHIAGSLTADISDILTLLPLDAASLAIIAANVNFAGGDWTYLRLDNGVYFEEVKAVDTTGSYLVVERGASGSTPKAFSMLDTEVSDIVGIDAITDIIAANPPVVTSNVTADGLAYNAGTEANPIITVDLPNFAGDGNVEVMGTYPNIQFALNLANSGCCGDGGTVGTGGGIASLIIDSGILQGSIVGQVLNLVLQTPSFTGAGTVAVTGTYPDFTITGASSTGGGSVVSVSVGAGLTLTGSSSVNPTVSITNTGVTAGDYSGFVVNARGQITALPVGFNPISDVTLAAGGTVSRTGGAIEIILADADVGVKGLVALADESAPLNPTDTASAVSPALLATYVSGSGSAGSGGAGSSTAEADGAYTDLQGATVVTVDVPAGKTALLMGQVQILDNTSPLTPVAFGVAVFDGTGVKRYGTKSCTQSLQAIGGHIAGPFSGTLVIKTTALPAGSTLQSAHLAVVIV